jgi:hypothetical protein
MDVIDPHELLPMDEVERRYALRVLDEARGNKRMAARILGYDRRTLERRLRRWRAEQEAAAAANAANVVTTSVPAATAEEPPVEEPPEEREEDAGSAGLR